MTPAEGDPRLTAGLLAGCVQRVFFGRVNAAAARVLAGDGCDVVVPGGQGCCGALDLHGGREEAARRRALQTMRAFAGVERVVGDRGRLRLGDEVLRRPPGHGRGARVLGPRP